MLDIFVDYVVPFVFVLAVLVFVHELGHFAVARRCGVRVDVFSIGFGPEIFGWTDRKGTRWKVCAMPFGGYVKMFGQDADADDDDEAELSEEDKAKSFLFKPVGQRAAIVAAGPAANFLLAVVLLTGLYSLAGVPQPLPVIGEVQAGSAAETAGIKTGDVVLRAAGEPVQWFADLRRVVAAHPDADIALDIRRADKDMSVTIHPLALEQDGERVGVIGVVADRTAVGYERMNPFAAGWEAVHMSVSVTVRIVTYVGQVIAGSRPAEEIGGPLRIAQMSGEVAAGGVANLIFFMAVLSLNLALINVFPIPMLDGGHLVYFGIEALRGRPLTARAQEYGFRFGLILVLLLMVFATWNDLVNLKVFELIKKFIT